jgi:hypothetical protein
MAPSDMSGEFAGSCGKCFEIKCRQESYTDGYSNYFDNAGQCHNTSESLVARVVDACPCDYPSNQYSNKRWCCQDKGAGGMHADLSVWAFEKLGRKGPGSMAMSYREVPCNYLPAESAYARPEEGTTPKDYPPKSARRPHEWTYVDGRTDSAGKTQGAVNRIEDPESAWAPIIKGDEIYRDGTFNLSFNGPFGYLTSRVVSIFGEAFFRTNATEKTNY